QTVVEVASERNSTLVMPVPVELLRFFEKMAPASPQPPAPPLADTGDAEVAEAEAEIGAPLAAQLPESVVPELAAPEEPAEAESPGETAASAPAPPAEPAPAAANGPRRPARDKPDS